MISLSAHGLRHAQMPANRPVTMQNGTAMEISASVSMALVHWPNSAM